MSSVAYPSTRYASALPQFGTANVSLFSQAGIAIFMLGVASGIPVQTVGRLFVGELGLMAISPAVAILLLGLSDKYGKTARLIVLAMIVSWIGYVISDMVRGTASNDYLRGWSRWIAMGASFATLVCLGSKNIGYLAAFLVGLSMGSCLAPLAMGGGLGAVQYWKFYAGVPACIVLLVTVRRLGAWASIGALLGLAMLSLALDTRSTALLCIIAAGVALLAARRSAGNRPLTSPVSNSSILAAAVLILGVMIVAVYTIRYFGERYGYTERFQHSNSTRVASATVAWSAIRDSPLIGYGSWPRDAELARERDKLVGKLKGIPAFRVGSQENLIIAHSQILQGWLEGGLLGLTFFALLAWQLVRQLSWMALVSPYMSLTPLIAFVLLECAWHLVFSPFSGGQRIFIPAACVFLCYIAEKRHELKLLQRSYS